jgi:hypothetical protein
MTIFVAPFHVGRAVMVEVLPGSFDTVMETLTLNITKLLRWCIPSTRSLVVTGVRGILRLGHDKARGSQSESKYWKCKSIEFHGLVSSVITAPSVQMSEFDALLYRNRESKKRLGLEGASS